MITNDYPVLTGDTVTERHARICRERGHATWTRDGLDVGQCPRCGDVPASTNYPAHVVAMFAILEDANVSDYQADALKVHCVTGSRYIRSVANNIERAAFTAGKGPAEREAAVRWYERAVTAWKVAS